MHDLSPTVLLILGLFMIAAAAEHQESKWLFDFRKAERADAWPAVNDGVMGGISAGDSTIANNALLFKGSLSLENNGGFSSVREAVNLDLVAYKGIRLRVKGDGRSYQLRLQTDSRFRDQPVSYSGSFDTKRNEWVEVDVPFSSLQQSFRGRNLSDFPFDPAKIELIGLLIADNKPGPFTLEVEWIKAFR
ncbi:MAG: CIA30 family protein [Verrucomicrobiota bacterium]